MQARRAAQAESRQNERLRRSGANGGTRRRKRAKKRNPLLWILPLVLIGIILIAGYRVLATIRQWEQKAEQSDFQIKAAEPSEVEDEIVNVAVFGADEEGLHTDVNMIVSFHTGTKQLNILSVPRDTKVVMTPEMTGFLESHDMFVPEREGVYGLCKLTEVHAYAGDGNRSTFSVAMLEELLGIQIDYYIKVDLSAFRDIVDAIGGVEMYVPQDMDYEDPVQDLYIHLKEGMQTLYGDEAEQLVRFRKGYASQDLQRIEVQQAFVKALIEKVCTSSTLLGSMNDLVQIVLEKTESNITLSDALQYVKYINQIDPSAVRTATVPGEGGSYYVIDEAATKVLVDDMIYGITPAEEDAQTEEGLADADSQSVSE